MLYYVVTFATTLCNIPMLHYSVTFWEDNINGSTRL